MKKFALLLGGAPLLMLTPQVHALDLVSAYREALSSDPVYSSARFTRDAGLESLPQGRAGLLPLITGVANTQDNRYTTAYSGDPAVLALEGISPLTMQYGNNWGYQITLTQPLFNLQAWANYKEGGYKAAQAEATFGQAAQDLVVRVAQAYFDVLASQDSLAFIQSQKTAISEQLAQAKRNFEVGTSTIVDTHEAQSRYDLAVSQEIAAISDLDVKKYTLRQIIGEYKGELAPLRARVELAPPKPERMENWVDAAENTNLSVQSQRAGVEVATAEINRLRAGHLPTVSLVANDGRQSTSIGVVGVPGAPSTDVYYKQIGVQLNVPFFSGGLVNSQVRQAVDLRDKARQDLENARRTAALNARQSYLGVANGIAQVKALEAALVSSQSSLDSNKLGYDVGVRINIDVLNAQQQLYQTKRDLSKAIYDTIMSGLKLRNAAGMLNDEDVQQVNAMLEK
jgi:outer membrane protein